MASIAVKKSKADISLVYTVRYTFERHFLARIMQAHYWSTHYHLGQLATQGRYLDTIEIDGPCRKR
jgi:hypothetical protein